MRSSVRAGVAVVLLAAAALLLPRAPHREDPAQPRATTAPLLPLASASSPRAIVSAVAPPASTPAPVMSADPVAPVCRDLLAHNERVLDGQPGPEEVSFSASCYPDQGGGGAWGLRL